MRALAPLAQHIAVSLRLTGPTGPREFCASGAVDLANLRPIGYAAPEAQDLSKDRLR